MSWLMAFAVGIYIALQLVHFVQYNISNHKLPVFTVVSACFWSIDTSYHIVVPASSLRNMSGQVRRENVAHHSLKTHVDDQRHELDDPCSSAPLCAGC